ncbi:MAG: hypothetical protein ACKVS8_02545 [Phycisphaerales bacterium]
MMQTAARWALRLGACFVIGPVAWWLTAHLRAADGSDHIPAILSTSPLLGLLNTLGAVVLAATVGVLTSRFVSLRAGLLNAGLVLTWAAAGAGTVETVARIWPDGSVLPRLAVEGLVLGLPVIAAVGLMVWAAGRQSVAAGEQADRFSVFGMPRAVLAELFGIAPRPAMLAEPAPLLSVGLGVLIAVVGAVLASWLVAQNMLKGQTIAAAAVGGLLAGAGLVLLDYRISPVVAVIGLGVVAAVSPVAGIFYSDLAIPRQNFDVHVFTGKLLPPARILPLDWLAGGLLGLSMGLSMGAWLSENKYREQAVGV